MQRYAVKMRSGGRVVTWASSDDVEVVEAEIRQLRGRHPRPDDVWIEDREPTVLGGCDETAPPDTE